MSAADKPQILVTAASSADAEQAACVVCMRVADLKPIADDDDSPLAEYERQVRARSTTELCSRCDAPIIVDNVSPKTPPRICVPCMPAMLAEHRDRGEEPTS